MTTNEAFKKIIEDKKTLDSIGINESTGRSLRKRFVEGKLSIEKIEEILVKTGFKIVQEKLWNI